VPKSKAGSAIPYVNYFSSKLHLLASVLVITVLVQGKMMQLQNFKRHTNVFVNVAHKGMAAHLTRIDYEGF
jgi:hypothetical protein